MVPNYYEFFVPVKVVSGNKALPDSARVAVVGEPSSTTAPTSVPGQS